ncbi:MFS transporter [Arthrobacter livingstonensis]|uniref:MFS transporter n=1 Tax=Arthrobacter livingstonensis TaxID=670078 RepID=A0A2V5LB74_9MICC|nr:MFS transporter [Arthrobacter livingstonensis]PYI68769.1 MFS transporter [Arthrobacter livingstonensis]
MSPTKQPTADAADVAPARLLRNPNYLWWLATDTSTAFGSALHSFSVPLLALYVTGSPAQAGIIAGIGQIGRVLATLPGGVVADRHNRRTLMVVGGVIGLFIGSALTALQLAGLLGFWLLTGLNLLMGMRNGFFSSTSNAALKSVVHAQQIGPAMAANEGRDAVIALSGGPAGGILMGFGRALPFAATAASHLLGIIAALMIRADLRPGERPSGAQEGVRDGARDPSPEGGQDVAHGNIRDGRQVSGQGRGGTGEDHGLQDPCLGDGRRSGNPAGRGATPAGRRVLRGFVAEAASGIKWLYHRPELRGIMILATVINLGLNSAITAVIFGLQQRGEGPAVIGVVSAGIGAGMLLGSLVAAPLVKRVGAGWIIIAGLFLMTASLAVLPFVSAIPAIMVVQAAAIFGAPAINAALLGYFMVAVPTELLGRAGSALDLLAMGATPLAPLVAGFGYALLGWTGVLLACAGICAVAACLALFNRSLRALPDSDHWADHAAAIVTAAR